MGSCDEDEFVGTFMEQLRDVVPQELTGGAHGSAAMEAGSSAVNGRALVGRANVPITSDAASEASDDPYDDTTIVVHESDSFVAPDPELVIRAYGITVGPEQGIKCGGHPPRVLTAVARWLLRVGSRDEARSCHLGHVLL
jgi:hypothetical protein